MESQIATIYSQKRLENANANLAIITIILDLINIYNNINTCYRKICSLILNNSAAQTL